MGRLVDHLFRHEAGRLLAALTRILGPRHLDLAEEVVQEALVKALQVWPFRGVPEKPAAWLVQAARNRALDLLRRDASLRGKEKEIAAAVAAATAPGERAGEVLGDDDLALLFMACHPLLSPEVRVALTLETVAAFSVDEIARAFLAEPATVAQRLVRARRLLREREVAFELPPPEELPARLDSVLEVVYLLFNEGYAAAGGPELVRADLAFEALRLAGLLAARPETALPRTHALAALLELQTARLPGRTGPDGELVLLRDQDRSLWDRRRIARGLCELDLAARGAEVSPYHLEAGIAAAHALAPTWESTDWPGILDLYDRLLAAKPSPVVALNRAVALCQVAGPEAALAELDAIREHPSLARYYLLPATEAELLSRLDRREEAAAALRAALSRPASAPERRLLERRLAALEVAPATRGPEGP